MELLDSYLRAVKLYLSRGEKNDIIEELSENILSQVEEQEAVLGRALTESEQLEILQQHGAYGMYLVHYAFASWLQYFLLPASMSGLVKGAVAFLGTVVLSWGAVAGLRRIPAVARVI
jgi:hypothetical protein